MAWSTPKTDWHCTVDLNGDYSGDRFNAVDFNRIKNNLEYLRDMSLSMYEQFGISSLGDDKTPRDYFYADEINQLEENLKTVSRYTLKISYGNAPVYQDNGATPDYIELNRLEGAILDLYGRLKNEYEGRRMLTWKLGVDGGAL